MMDSGSRRFSLPKNWPQGVKAAVCLPETRSDPGVTPRWLRHWASAGQGTHETRANGTLQLRVCAILPSCAHLHRQGAQSLHRDSCSSGTTVAMMQAADLWNRDHRAAFRRVDLARDRGVVIQGEMRA